MTHRARYMEICSHPHYITIQHIITIQHSGVYLTIIPRARMSSKSIAHEAEGRMDY